MIIIKEEDEKDYKIVRCLKCKEFKLNDNVKQAYTYSTWSNHYKLSCWIREQNDDFNISPEVDKEKIKDILNSRDKKIKEKFDLIMKYFSNDRIRKDIELDNDEIMVKCWIKDASELRILVKKVINDKYADIKHSQGYGNNIVCTFNNLTFKGLEYIEELQQPNKNSNKIFVAFNFIPEMIDIFETYVKSAIEETGFIYTIVNQETTPHDQKITDEIIAGIKSSRMIITDFTNNSTNVYFEAGFAMGMKIPVIWTCKEGHKYSFDTGQFPHITWKSGEDLKKQLVNRIKAIM
jgi:hypothetical protein